ncbi:hypothetical protein NCG97_07300 [Streptomyces lydicamycinicus]|uniref:hypothetical protein n=1 Tax=Streptomyces lydicamycinicus TaxID=1546107 RepID=UPI00131C4FE0|nr:hypothetical protein [Streptomyces lydicamycinicus]USA00525.1 hypothetical protein NCG97_07300 [Streptomyces lydicamycinicus]
MSGPDTATARPFPQAVDGSGDDCPLPVIEVNPGASWLHIAATVRERLLDRARGQLRSDDWSRRQRPATS